MRPGVLWRLMEALSLFAKANQQFGGPIARVLRALTFPVVALRVSGLALRFVLPDIHRSVRVWRHILPIFTGYMWTQYSTDLAAKTFQWGEERVEERWAARHEIGGAAVFNMIDTVRGYYVKTGQVLATKREFVPPQWCTRLANLWDNTQPRPWRQVQDTILRDLRATELADEMRAVQCCQASKNQNQYYELTSSPIAPRGRSKSRRGRLPCIVEEDDEGVDNSNAGAACRPRRMNRKDKELSVWFEHIDHEALASASIAQVHTAKLSAATVQLLGESWPHGRQVVVKVQHNDVQRLMGADLRNMTRIARFLKHVLPFDVTPAVKEMQTVIPKEFDFVREARLMSALRQRLLKAPYPCTRVVVPEPVGAMCGPGLIVMQRMEGTPLTWLLTDACEGQEDARVAGAKCIEPLLHAYGYMMLVGGLFHADPHAGNILLQEDGKVVLLDFGQCKALTTTERHALCTMFVSLATGDIATALKVMEPFGLTFTNSSSTSKSSSQNSESNSTQHCQAPASTASEDNDTQMLDSDELESSLSKQASSDSQVHAVVTLDIAAAHGKAEKHDVGNAMGQDPAQRQQHCSSTVDLKAAEKMLLVMFDTKWMPEAVYSFGGGDVVDGVSLAAFPSQLYLICRAVLILRGICAALQIKDLSAVQIWKHYAEMGLAETPEESALKEAHNALLDNGLEAFLKNATSIPEGLKAKLMAGTC